MMSDRLGLEWGFGPTTGTRKQRASAPGFPLAAPCLSLIALAIPALAQPIPKIQQTKTLTCAIDQGTPDYTTEDPHGPRIAFDLELCHTAAVAIAGPSAKVLPLLFPDEASTRQALRTGKADLIPTTSLQPAPKDLLLGPPILLDSVDFLVSESIPDARALSGKKVCFFDETPTVAILRDWFARNHLDYVPYPFSEEGEMQAAFMTGNCPAVAGDLTRLADLRQGSGSIAAHARLLPEILAPDPLGPATMDAALQRVVTAVYQLLLHPTQPPAAPGLSPTWSTDVLQATGPYTALYTRTLLKLLGPVPAAKPLN